MEQNSFKTGCFSHPIISFTISTVVTGMDIDSIRCVILCPDNHETQTGSSDDFINTVGARLCRYLDGAYDDFSDVNLDFTGLTDFQIRVLEGARKIPRGSCVTYSELANRAGYPDAVRAVASVMRMNRFPLIIPCHRIVRKDGSIGGYCGQQSGKMAELKQRLLSIECCIENYEIVNKWFN
jgi:methylated-DNA-[protein]-cysteine S-methyltransferase